MRLATLSLMALASACVTDQGADGPADAPCLRVSATVLDFAARHVGEARQQGVLVESCDGAPLEVTLAVDDADFALARRVLGVSGTSTRQEGAVVALGELDRLAIDVRYLARRDAEVEATLEVHALRDGLRVVEVVALSGRIDPDAASADPSYANQPIDGDVPIDDPMFDDYNDHEPEPHHPCSGPGGCQPDGNPTPPPPDPW